MAKQTATTQAQPKNTPPLIPTSTDPRAELYFLLGKAGYDCSVQMANRMTELVTLLTAPPAASTNGTGAEE